MAPKCWFPAFSWLFCRHRSDGDSRFVLVGGIRSQMTWFLAMPANIRCFDIIISDLSLAFLAPFLGARRLSAIFRSRVGLRNSSFQGLIFVRPP